MPSSATPRPTSARRWIRLPAVAGLVAAAALIGSAGPAHADDILPTLTSFTVSAPSADVTYGDAHISVLMSVTDPDATGTGTGDIIAHGPTRDNRCPWSFVDVFAVAPAQVITVSGQAFAPNDPKLELMTPM